MKSVPKGRELAKPEVAHAVETIVKTLQSVLP